jgi:A/G-specific adenine glycosylase
VETITKILGNWYAKCKRDLPWRATNSAYKIWLSEIILQQTRVNQGIGYYEKILRHFPDIQDLAQANIDDVLKLWQGLGYYTRARNLHQTACEIVDRYGGLFPDDYETLRSLKGIGDYTAAAIASIAFNIPVALVDGNVLRVLARIYGITTPVSSPAGKKKIQQQAIAILDKKNPGNHNQALMELGALICLPKSPLCPDCPLRSVCYAFGHNRVNDLPVKEIRIQNKKRYFHYLHIVWSGMTFIYKRYHKDIWNSLYEFPLIETARAVKPGKIQSNGQWEQLLNGSTYFIKSTSPLYIHKLTHQTIYARFYHIGVSNLPAALKNDYTGIEEDRIFEYPVSRLTEKYLTEGLD